MHKVSVVQTLDYKVSIIFQGSIAAKLLHI